MEYENAQKTEHLSETVIQQDGEYTTNEPRHAIMCLREINYVMRYDVLKSDVIISRRA